MSIANISSENLKGGQGFTDAEFTIDLKKPIQSCIGMQLLGATIPLSYNIFNPDEREFHFTSTTPVNNTTETNTRIAYLSYGTYTDIDDLCKELERSMNGAEYSAHSHRNETQRNLCIANRRLRFQLVPDDASMESSEYNLDTVNTFKYTDIEPGMIVREVIEGAEHTANPFFVRKTDGAGNAWLGLSVMPTNITEYELYYPNFLVLPEPGYANRIVIASNDIVDLVISPTLNSRRMLKTFGFTGLETYRTSDDEGDWSEYKFYGNFMHGDQAPEPVGPSMLFLRLGGDIILDQQNSETAMNDRIPITLDQPHGGIVHFENNSAADVIPFSVPCDVRKMSFRLEYGDDNTVVGGPTHNLRGHHTYYRIKFYKKHQQQKTHI